MIIRILGEGQLDVDDSLAGELNKLDARLEAAVSSGDEAVVPPGPGRDAGPGARRGNTGAGGFV